MTDSHTESWESHEYSRRTEWLGDVLLLATLHDHIEHNNCSEVLYIQFMFCTASQDSKDSILKNRSGLSFTIQTPNIMLLLFGIKTSDYYSYLKTSFFWCRGSIYSSCLQKSSALFVTRRGWIIAHCLIILWLHYNFIYTGDW